mmetsp:Transcript_21813/g.68349  ORF Transcript_21813/g.68349 Transcript_21813/m.68349 type:complete len:375 (+) Transcript_21813:192-1316(+)|eukprot:CAMPEP_0197391996 /NCGR_PEP_ID=MMETSP1165-20131217/3454_1 /TAXON_ID=284809 /ORGANISM="Chrysocystis fragilis, Strain CCMP3189" /LENGTH=374 /DNA_ID=CAMNT_0042917599 /DNA_START=141 /DNA_END=1265 /DNA_ORIENTATION=+
MKSAVTWIVFLPAAAPFANSGFSSRVRNSWTTQHAVGAARRGSLGAQIVGVGSCVPDAELQNHHIAEFVETSDEWIAQRTGISKRRILSPTESLCDMATAAATKALESAQIDAEDLDLVLMATSSPDDLFGDATTVAARIGASAAVAFDLTAACSGFIFALVTGSQFLHSGTYATALVIGADALSRWVDWEDRNTCILFGDGAGAVVLKYDVDGGILGFDLKSNGLDQQYLRLAYAGVGRELNTSGNHLVCFGAYQSVTMNGREVYKFATREVPLILESALENAELTVNDVDWLLLHQANHRIMAVVADRLGLPSEKVLSTLSEHGNTSAGSIPLALDAAVKGNRVKAGDIIACAGFGAGLSWGAAIIRWDQHC